MIYVHIKISILDHYLHINNNNCVHILQNLDVVAGGARNVSLSTQFASRRIVRQPRRGATRRLQVALLLLLLHQQTATRRRGMGRLRATTVPTVTTRIGVAHKCVRSVRKVNISQRRPVI